MRNYNKDREYKVTDINYYEEHNVITDKKYWDILVNTIDPTNGIMTPECIRTESDNEVLQAITAHVIPDLKEDMIKAYRELKFAIVSLQSKCNDLEQTVRELKSKKWYQFWK